ncbi:hypothetical protein DXM27_05315 [Rhizobium rhizogenes]|uniref:Uncharacterized protein n=1 Tax=Rhizobium rhizogenes TaxID=359 RepID=A0AA88F4K6_RHIRH|nr:hypothetical protein [Rhizobium rhizogenes]KAA3504630.1 hypothetical protein DXM27_05315 [Rhizobium rhizogenes]
MTSKYRAEQYISISASESGTELELQMVVDFTVHPGAPATTIDPAELTSAEVNNSQFFLMQNGKPKPEPVSMMVWMIDRFTEGGAFQEWLLSEAADQHQAALEDYADQRREMMQEERL